MAEPSWIVHPEGSPLPARKNGQLALSGVAAFSLRYYSTCVEAAAAIDSSNVSMSEKSTSSIEDAAACTVILVSMFSPPFALNLSQVGQPVWVAD